MNLPWNILVIYLLIVNLAAVLLYGVDKRRARRRAWRVTERMLLGISFAGGCVGAFAGMRVFRHKTKHLQFQILVPLSMVLWAVLLVWLALR